LDVGELLSLWTIEGNLNYPWGAILKLLMLTGARLKEVSEVTWDEISLEEQIWSIPSSRTKNSRPHQIHLSTQAIQILRSLPSVKDQSFLFSTNGVRPVSGFSKAKKRIDLLSGVDNWRFHDLRRSFATYTTEKLEIPPVVIDKVLNHVSGAVKGVAAIYQRGEYLEQRREALQAWGDYLEDLGKCH
jgi:integrase